MSNQDAKKLVEEAYVLLNHWLDDANVADHAKDQEAQHELVGSSNLFIQKARIFISRGK